jgi:hypothetical protein
MHLQQVRWRTLTDVVLEVAAGWEGYADPTTGEENRGRRATTSAAQTSDGSA